jgi:hypothetical protein
MNRAKLVKLGEEILTNIDIDLEGELRKNLEKELCLKLSSKFAAARRHLVFFEEDNESHKEDYVSVKPILDDCIDKLLGNTK